MDLTNETFAPLRVMIDEFVRAGVEYAVVAPGSRNAPIAYVIGDHEGLKTWSVLDDRQAGFFALGLAKSTGKPAIVTCTSGSAAANLHPAVIEASHAGVPLIVLTADRPPELRDVGAGQAIDQINLYGGAARWFVEAGNHPVSDQTLRHFRALGSRAVAEATATNPGPVHINLPLREPLRPIAGDLGDAAGSLGAVGRPDGAPWTAEASAKPLAEDLYSAAAAAKHPIIVIGDQHQRELALTISHFATATGIPVFADSLSQLRRAQLAEHTPIVAAYDLILRSQPVTHQLVPDLIIRVGELPTSKPLRNWLAAAECRQIVLDPRGAWLDPTRNASDVWVCDPLATFTAASGRVEGSTAAPSWTATWTGLERATQSAIDHALAVEPFPFEPAIYRSLLGGLERGATIFVSSSMPIRDVEAYGPIGRDDMRYLSNRGTNGIDGVISTALGVRAPYNCDRVIVLTGDLAFLYDASALAIAAKHEIPLTIVCVDNDGGGIFSFLPVAEHEAHFEDLIATPSGVDVEAVATAYGFGYAAPRNVDELRAAVEQPGFVHLKTDRAANKAGHDRVAGHVLESVAAALTETGAFH
ncbi:MAG: 2-succinyl-5-enolpyruvyl-6-hydroxy-3-cyclohexene-1-carboxylic-acid synthase [Thermoleophilaceae bacterium]|nr:2-succinyl-5-enolpyruvyl-6-hydroxy-3-cyclohexene-1-carboxylic-acid synthase [Thermoleophilaceae bacterium]